MVPIDYPFRTSLKAGERVFWCSCGLSGTQPYCDGSHKGTSHKPLAHVESIDLTVAMCGCKRTQRPPYCDGSHVDERKPSSDLSEETQ